MEKLDWERSQVLHNMTARGLFITKRACGDIHMAISFLSTWVRMPDLDDWKKLQHLMKYLEETAYWVSTLRANKVP